MHTIPPRICARTSVLVAIALGALAVAHPATARADTTPARSITLGGVLQVTLRQNPTLAFAVIDVQTAQARIVQETGIDDWVVNAAASWGSLRTGSAAGDVVGITASDSVNLSTDLTRAMPSGATLGLRARGGFSTRTFTLGGSESRSFTGSLSASYLQPLMRGRGKHLARASLAKARIAMSAAEKTREASAISVVQQVILAYWDLAFALHDVAIRKSSLVLAQERLRLTLLRIKAGTVAKVEALAVEQVMATREEEVLVAELQISDRSLRLRRLAGMAIGPSEIDLTTVAPLSVRHRALSVDDLVARAYRFSPELASLEIQKKGQRIDVEVTKNGLMPRLDLSFNIGPTGTSDRFRTTAKQIATLNGVSVGATLTFSQAINRRSARGANRVARSQLWRTKVSIADVKAQIALAVAIAVKTAHAAQLRMRISERAIDLSKKNIVAEQGRYSLGRATNFDVARRQEELKTAQLRYARAAFDYLKTIAQLDALTGDLLPKYGITLAPASRRKRPGVPMRSRAAR